MKLRDIKEFNLGEGIFVGGVNGSLRVRSVNEKDSIGRPVYYQLKQSILDSKSVLRKAKSRWTDRVNLGEFIAAAIARSVLGDNNAPEVFLVYDKERRRVLIASKYLEGDVVQTLDEYAQSQFSVLEMGLHRARKKHVSLTRHISDVERGCIALSTSDCFRKLSSSLARSIAISMLLGDHDVNPSNMVVVTNTSHESHVGRIDLGHAWNNLLTAPKFFGGVCNHENGLLDFLNRELVSGVKLQHVTQLGEPSKLWRDYPGIVPSHELSHALSTLSKEDNLISIKSGLDMAKIGLLELIQSMYKENDKEGVKHMLTSLFAIQSTLDPTLKMKYTDGYYKDADKIIQDVFDTLKVFCYKQHTNLQFISKLMKLQANIDDMLIFDEPSDFDPARAFEKFRQRFQITEESIEWIKTCQEAPAIRGTLDEYVASRQAQLINNQGYKLEQHTLPASQSDEDVQSLFLKRIQTI